MNWRSLTAILVTVVTLGFVAHVAAQAPMAKPDAPKADAPKADAPKPADAAKPTDAAKPAEAPKPAPIIQKKFGSAEETVDALIAAMRAHDTKTMLAVLGAESRPVVVSGDPVADRRNSLYALEDLHRP